MTGGLPSAVLFDYNGTIADDETIVYEALDAMHRAHFGRPLAASDYFARLVGRSDDEILLDALSRYDHSPELTVNVLRAELRHRYRRAVESVEVISPDTNALIRALHAAGVKVGVVTGAQRDEVVPVLAAAGLLPLFGALVTVEDVRQGKPSPEGYLLGKSLLGLAETDCVVAVEDSVVGLRAARAAGLRTVAVAGSHPLPTLRTEADYVIDRLDSRLLSLEPFTALSANIGPVG